jgi:hypothetical protein
MTAVLPALRRRRLCALDVEPLRLRGRASVGKPAAVAAAMAPTPAVPVADAPPRIARLALHPDPAELRDPALYRMYIALTEAVGKAGLQSVRVCDVADDPAAAVVVFGAATLPDGVPAQRVLRADPLAELHADRARKRLLWERMQALSRDGSG